MNKEKKELLFAVLRLGESVLLFLLIVFAAYCMFVRDHEGFVECALVILLIRNSNE